MRVTETLRSITVALLLRISHTWHAGIESIHRGPLASALLAGLVENLGDKGLAIVVLEAEDVGGNLDEERVKDALVPLSENIAHLLAGKTKTTLHNVVGLRLLALVLLIPAFCDISPQK